MPVKTPNTPKTKAAQRAAEELGYDFTDVPMAPPDVQAAVYKMLLARRIRFERTNYKIGRKR